MSTWLFSTDWRKSRLLILCYHGVSLDDEHLWDPSMHLSPEVFRSRLKCLRDNQCAILPLAEGVDRLYKGTLPPRSVVLTFDDGFHDFHAAAWPILKEFSAPATVYQTTYYSEFNRPVFDPMCSYLVWKSPSSRLDWPEVTGAAIQLPEGRAKAVAAIKSYCLREKLSARDKDLLLLELAGRLGVEMETLLRRRILHLMNAKEIREIAAAGIDVQLHTHRHVAPSRNEALWAEVDENREHIERLTGRTATHFCYPSGIVRPGVPELLRQRGVVTGTTARAGLASRTSDPLLLRRVFDTCSMTEVEFEGWLTGVECFLPRRPLAQSSRYDDLFAGQQDERCLDRLCRVDPT
ncbi:MAG: polysaccharide deacetylase family protein [Acidobacteria bacterium]|nr:polysaccharide deacetylase family protein [Acidobacteriota bacterium]